MKKKLTVVDYNPNSVLNNVCIPDYWESYIRYHRSRKKHCKLIYQGEFVVNNCTIPCIV